MLRQPATGTARTVSFVVSDANGSSGIATRTVALSSTPADFVTALYQKVLNRVPDSSGLAFYKNLLATGTSPNIIASAFWESNEHRGIQVDSYYQMFLHRGADPAGRQAWVDQMLGGMTEETVMIDFLSSAEYQRFNGNSDRFVAAVYRDALGRPADPGGLSSFASMLSSQVAGPATVAELIVTSHERHLSVVDSLYGTLFQRAPEATGEDYFAQQLDLGLMDEQSLAEAFLSSQEFLNNHPLS
jgi:hypothetical protein